MDNTLENLIKKSLDYYDNLNEKYKNEINDSDAKFNLTDKTIGFNKDINNYEILGLFDTQTKIWLWSWLLPNIVLGDSIISRDLLNYGLSLQPTEISENDHLFLKTQLTNSRFILEDEFQLQIHLSICSYLSKKKFKFIYPKINNISRNNYLIIYYLVK